MYGTDGLYRLQVLSCPGSEDCPCPPPAFSLGPAGWEGECAGEWILSQQKDVKEVPTPVRVPGKRLEKGDFQSHLNMGGR